MADAMNHMRADNEGAMSHHGQPVEVPPATQPRKEGDTFDEGGPLEESC